MPFIDVNEQQLYFEDSGNKSGYPIVMMHGFLMDQSLFDQQVAALQEDYRCIRFDARGFGKTGCNKQPFSLYDTVADCISLMDHIRIDRAHIIGMSQGGYAALRMAIKHPDRINALVLMSTWAGIDDNDTKAQFLQVRDTWVKDGPVEPMLERLATVLLGPESIMKHHWQTWLPKWRKYSSEAIFHAMNNLIDRDDISPRLQDIEHPTLVIHGDSDVGMPWELGEQLSKRLNNCHGFLKIKDAAHAANLTHYHPINEAIVPFLAQHSR